MNTCQLFQTDGHTCPRWLHGTDFTYRAKKLA